MTSSLKFMKCVFFTNQQFNIDKIHIPKNSFYIEDDIANMKNLENYVNQVIDNVYDKLNEGNTTGSPFKIPAPIFILAAKKLDYKNNILDKYKFKSPYKYAFKYGSETIIPNDDGTLAISSYLQSFFKSGLAELPRDEDNLKKSFASSYGFKGRMKVIIYIPYLTNKFKYITNFTDILNSSRFFLTIVSNKNFLTFNKTTTETYESLKNKYNKLDEQTIKWLYEIRKNEEMKQFTFYEDLMNLCVEGGCVSDYGEDISSITTAFTEDSGKNNEMAITLSPYMPSKCLAQTKGYINNIKNVSGNVDLPEFLRLNALPEIKQSLNEYILISDKLTKGEKLDDRSKDIANYTSPIDLIISIINKYIRTGYSANLNEGSRDGIKRLNYYSKEYSKNIIRELSILNKFYPGIPEIVMSSYIYDETIKKDKIIYHPWGRKIISSRNVLTLGDKFPVNKSLFSFNNRFIMTLTSKAIIYVYDRTNGNVLYFINRNPIENTLAISIETTMISVEYIDSNNNTKSAILKLPNDITSLIDDCDECKQPPFNLILDDNDGSIIIYANSFYNATNKKFNNYIKDEKKNGERLNFNINDTEFKTKIGTNIEIGLEEDYIFCSDKDTECKK